MACRRRNYRSYHHELLYAKTQRFEIKFVVNVGHDLEELKGPFVYSLRLVFRL